MGEGGRSARVQLARRTDKAFRGRRCALAWLLAKPVITAPIVGATKLHHLDDALASVNVKLSADEITSLEEPYVPHSPKRSVVNTLRSSGWAVDTLHPVYEVHPV